MAGLGGTVSFSGTSLSAATAKTAFVASAPSNQRVKVTGWNLSFNGTVNSNTPILVVFQNASAAGTSTAFTPIPKEPECTETFQGTYGINATVEPTYTASAYRRQFYVHPQLGQEVYFPQGQEIYVKGGGILGIQINAPQAVSVSGWVDIEE
jgi:hypothetical protein